MIAADETRVVRLLIQDVVDTIGPGHEATIRATAAQVRSLGHTSSDYLEKVAE